MKHLKIKSDGELSVITMSSGKANALSKEMIQELTQALTTIREDDEIRGMVLASDNPRFFSSGFDVNVVFSYEREEMKEFFGLFMNLYEGLAGLPKPAVASIAGHAFAGGAILALACDLRILAMGKYGYVMNEIDLGLVLPRGVLRMLVDVVGVHQAGRLLLEGKVCNPEEALAIGLADALVPSEKALDQALARARVLARKPPRAFGAIKSSLGAVQAAIQEDRRALDEFIDSWFSEESQRMRRALAESLKK